MRWIASAMKEQETKVKKNKRRNGAVGTGEHDKEGVPGSVGPEQAPGMVSLVEPSPSSSGVGHGVEVATLGVRSQTPNTSGRLAARL